MLEKYPSESAVFDIDCSALLLTGETISGTPSMSFFPALTGDDALTIGSPVVNTDAVTYSDGRVVAARKSIQVRISGGTSVSASEQRVYSVTATFSTSTSQTLTAKALLRVLPVTPY